LLLPGPGAQGAASRAFFRARPSAPFFGGGCSSGIRPLPVPPPGEAVLWLPLVRLPLRGRSRRGFMPRLRLRRAGAEPHSHHESEVKMGLTKEEKRDML